MVNFFTCLWWHLINNAIVWFPNDISSLPSTSPFIHLLCSMLLSPSHSSRKKISFIFILFLHPSQIFLNHNVCIWYGVYLKNYWISFSENDSSMHSALSYKISLVILWFISFSAAIKTNNRSRVLFLLDVAWKVYYSEK